MPLFGALFVSELIKKPVLDPSGEDLGFVRDFIVVKGEPLPRLSALIVEKKKVQYHLNWKDLSIFNKRIISSSVRAGSLKPYVFSEDDLLIGRDILDKQIVDINGVKVVRVNDVKLEGFNGDACLIAVDVGMLGILRRLGIEHRGENLFRIFGKKLSQNLISWNYIQPLAPKLTTISLTVPRQMLSELHPADIAEIISQVSRLEGATLFKGLDPETAAEALHELEPDVQTALIGRIDKEQASDIIERMPPDEAADVIADLPAEKAKEILELIEKEEAEDIQELLGHEEDTSGGRMTNEYIAYAPGLRVSEAIERFREDAKEVEAVYYIYIVDVEEKLIGVISLRELLLAPPDTPLSEIMETKLKTVAPESNYRVVSEMLSKYNLLAIPVVDPENVFLGIVTIDDIIDILLPPVAKKKRRRV